MKDGADNCESVKRGRVIIVWMKHSIMTNLIFELAGLRSSESCAPQLLISHIMLAAYRAQNDSGKGVAECLISDL